MGQRILLVDDEVPFVRGLAASLRQAGYEVLTAYDGHAAWAQFQAGRPDLVLLDIMLPGTDGFALCQRIRQHAGTPVIMLTARAEDVDKVLGLELGADDYVTKPFHFRELLARIKAVLRRAQGAAGPGRLLRLGHVTLDLDRQAVWRDGEPVDLAPREYDLLAFLATHPGRVFSREELLDRVWGPDYLGDAKTVDVHVRRLREKLERAPDRPTLIRTRWGRGYYLEPGTGGDGRGPGP